MLLSKNLLFSTLGSQRNMYRSMLDKWGLLTVALSTLSPNISAPKQKFEKQMLRMLGCSVCNVPLQNSSFHDIWL